MLITHWPAGVFTYENFLIIFRSSSRFILWEFEGAVFAQAGLWVAVLMRAKLKIYLNSGR